MYHYLYKTTSQSGKYYVGRHSTKNLNDNYIGSGKWVRSVKNKEKLTVEILEYFDNISDLKIHEEILINKVINDPLNMNFNNSSVGFSTGELNPSCSDSGKYRLIHNNWMQTEEGRKYASENNPSKMQSVKEKRRLFALEQLQNGTHPFLNDCNGRYRYNSENNPAKTDKHKNKMREKLQNGTHPFCIKVTCPHCDLTGNKANMKRYHFEKCKLRKL